MTHSWCKSPARDEAVRAAEDGRQGPLPTLEECIERVTERRPVDAGGGGNVTVGLRTERVTLELTHFGPESVASWEWKYHIRPRHIFDSVRVVEESDRLEVRVSVLQAAVESARNERDAATRERDTLRAERITQALTADRFAAAVAEADTLKARVAELESSAPAASGAAGAGWLTAEEREVISYFREACQGQHERAIGNDSPRWGEIYGRRAAVLQRLVARSSPPEVVRPGQWKDAGGPGHPQVSWQPFLDTVTGRRDAEWLSALAAAGVPVKEVG